MAETTYLCLYVLEVDMKFALMFKFLYLCMIFVYFCILNFMLDLSSMLLGVCKLIIVF